MQKNEGSQFRLNSSKPTTVSQQQLTNWVVWQYPKKIAGGYCGAVHPPTAASGWLPAVIYRTKKEVQIYGHVTEPFDSPESAAEYCMVNGRSSNK